MSNMNAGHTPRGVLPNKEVGGGGLDLTSSLDENLAQGPAKLTK